MASCHYLHMSLCSADPDISNFDNCIQLFVRCCMVCLTASCGSFGRSRMPPHGLALSPDEVITSRMYCASCTGSLSGNESITRLRAWCTSQCLVWHRHIWLMTSTLSQTAATAFCDQQPTGRVIPRTDNTFGDRSLLLLVRGCESIYHLSCNRTSDTDVQTTTENISVRDQLTTTTHRDCLIITCTLEILLLTY